MRRAQEGTRVGRSITAACAIAKRDNKKHETKRTSYDLRSATRLSFAALHGAASTSRRGRRKKRRKSRTSVSMRRQFITTLVLLLRSIISIGAANKCTDGSAVKDLIGFTLDGERVSNTKLEAVRWRRFEGLLAERGVRSLVGIADCGRLRGLRATRDIEAGESLLSMPRRLILDELHADSSDVAALWNASSLPAPPAFLKLALLVLHESRGGDEALLAPFVALMPTADDIAFEGGPAWMWSQEELALTECEKIVADAAAKRQTIDEMPIFSHTHLTPTWRQAKLPGEPPSREEILWAVAVVTTRWYAGNPLLVPIYDMANHALEPNARAGFDQEAGGGSADFKMVATRSIAQSDQVLWVQLAVIASSRASNRCCSLDLLRRVRVRRHHCRVRSSLCV